ncbi:bacillithiol system redox-active protein YtxJ [Bacillus sp. CGMCC 1.16607]|uniref:bacillithiol system redox-active protein YtxJ n=1 Tax=Bacillus sp. CGMCC 1.16607 TaxID=3351842 RepID=UPI00363DF9F6
MKQIHSVDELTEVINHESMFYLLKHSTTCPVSQAAFEEYEKFSKENADMNCYFLTVQDSRPLSNHIAEQYQIKHESPQAFLFKNQNVKWNASHWKITNTALNSVLKENA